jgi:glycosyltransferase involved in cell wall biosynthesis
MSYFSIVIPLYNKAAFIENTLQSVFAQTFQDFELIIVDDGSTDDSLDKIAALKNNNIQLFSKENGGVSSARNFGITKASSPYITFLDADDYWYPDFLSTMYEAIQIHKKESVFAGAFEIEAAKKVFPAAYSIALDQPFLLLNYFKASQRESIIWTSCAVFEKSVFEKVGVFDETIKSEEDTDLWIRIGLQYPVVFCSKILARYVFDANSLSRNLSYNSQKINFSKFLIAEKTNSALHFFLDTIRFSWAIKSKLNKDNSNFELFCKAINKDNLNFKKKVLLKMPRFVLFQLIELQKILVQLGLTNSVFK